jgi:membrane fusion protein, multidrug efflux system
MPVDPPKPVAPRSALRAITVTVAVVAVVVIVGGTATRFSQARTLRKRAEAEALPIVIVHRPGEAEAAATLELPGRIEAYSRAPIYARVSGYLKSWYADIGTRVKAGQLLAEIETPDLDQQLLQAQAELANARANAALAATTAKRWQSLLTTDSVSRQEVEEKTSDLAAKQSEVNALLANVERFQALKRFARIVAPFDGIVTARSTDVGSLINVGSAQGPDLFVVSDTSKLRVYVNVPQNYATVVGRGTKAMLSVPERPGKLYSAVVQSTSHAISAGSGSMLVQLTADNAGAELLPGGFARVRFELPATTRGLAIPSSALIFDKAGLRVATVAADGKVVLKPVTLARDNGATIDVATGLDPDDKVIESPPDGIVDGDRVRIAPSDGNATTPSGTARGARGKQ